MLFGSSAYLKSLYKDGPLLFITIVGIPISFAKKLKSLGVIITPTLNWSDHLHSIRVRVYSSHQSLKFYKNALAHPVRKNLVEALIFLHFNYACAVYISPPSKILDFIDFSMHTHGTFTATSHE